MVLLLTVSGDARAHEFWLEPSSFTPVLGAKTTITHRNGQYFKGNSYPYLKEWFSRFTITDAAGERAVEGIDGDDPAATLVLKNKGPAVVAYVSNPDLVIFDDLAKFTSYLKDEGIPDISEAHRRRGLPETDIKEHYVRCAKSLLGADGAIAKDATLGLPIELVVETGAEEAASRDRVSVRVLHRGKPSPATTIKVFRKSAPNPPARFVTDTNGRATVELPAGDIYLLNAVVLEEPPAGSTAHWLSLWASTTLEMR
jgi:hypothetical protein